MLREKSLTYLTPFFITGIYLSSLMKESIPPEFSILPCLPALSVSILLSSACKRARFTLLCLIFLLTGFLLHTHHVISGKRAVARVGDGIYAGTSLIVEGERRSAKGSRTLLTTPLSRELEGISPLPLYNIPPHILPKTGDTLCCTLRIRRTISDGRIYGVAEGEATLYSSDRSSLKGRIMTLREQTALLLEGYYPKSSERDAVELMKALFYGEQKGIEREIYDSFRESGALHLLALSGMHLGIIYGALSLLFSILGRSPSILKARSIMTIIILWGYTIYAGASTSLLRAMVMITIYETGAIMGREKNGINALSFSALIISLSNPAAPLQISFQLSYSAMAGIFLLFPLLRRAISPSFAPFRYIWDLLALSISCQCFTAPLIYLHFGTFGYFSLIANLLCSPITSITILLIPLRLLSGAIFPEVGVLIGKLLYISTELLIRINEIIASII